MLRIAGWGKLFRTATPVAPSSKEGSRIRAAASGAGEGPGPLRRETSVNVFGSFRRTKRPRSQRGFVNLQASEWSPISGRHRGSLSVPFFHCGLPTKLDAALIVHADALDPNGIADLHDILSSVDTEVRELRNVAKAILSGQDFHEGTELLDGYNRAFIDLAHGDLLGHAEDDLLGSLEALAVAGIDMH